MSYPKCPTRPNLSSHSSKTRVSPIFTKETTETTETMETSKPRVTKPKVSEPRVTRPRAPRVPKVKTYPDYDIDFSDLPWNGSHLGKYSEDIIIFKDKKVTKLEYKDKVVIVAMSFKNVGTAAFFEVIKPLFHIQQRGFHLINIGGRECIIYFILCDGDTVLEFPLGDANDVDDRDEYGVRSAQFMAEVSKILAFQIVCGVRINNSSIIVRGDMPVSCECATVNDEKSKIPTCMARRWLVGTSVCKELSKLFTPDDVYGSFLTSVREVADHLIPDMPHVPGYMAAGLHQYVSE